MSSQSENSKARQLWLVPGEGQQVQGLVAEVAVEIRTPRLYSYSVPADLITQVQPGVCVTVPYGRQGRSVDGICTRVSTAEWEHTHPPIVKVINPRPLLTEKLIELGLWISKYYVCAPGLTLKSLVPSALRQPQLRKVTYLRATGQTVTERLTVKQQALMDILATGDHNRTEALNRAGVGSSVAKRLVQLGLVEAVIRREPVPPAMHTEVAAPAESPEDAFELTASQRAALDEIATATTPQCQFRAFLLYGVPGSGKTEVYVRAIRRVVAAGRQAILLVPEIALATQVVERLARRFARVAVLHSRLAAGARRDTLHAIAAGAVDVVIGTRTAVFAPCPSLGLLVVDEEQDSSLKSLATPLYHARDVALKRGQLEGMPVVLGSATPALETWYNVKHLDNYQLLHLPERIPGADLPEVRLIATDTRALGQTTTVLSEELIARLCETVKHHQQAILLHNRRGYAVNLRCTTCGLVVSCSRCAAHLVFHQTDSQMHCHRCGVRTDVPAHCLDDTCQGRLTRSGLAIQRLEEELQRVVPEARLLRLDSDTMRRRQDYAEALSRFESGQADILLGTQMVAKGLDFPGVRLVGVIDADAVLSFPDFRAGEIVFQLLMQVVGRAGRREGHSLALVQSGNVGAPAIRYGIEMDYESFAAAELEARRRYFLPPVARMVRLILADERPGRAATEAGELSGRLRKLATRVSADLCVDEAETCVVPRLREMFRYGVIVRGPRDGSMQRLLHEAVAEKYLAPRVRRFTIDVDPVDML
ncbi:MAG: primosomal protein N' [Planctomycetota bacterium]